MPLSACSPIPTSPPTAAVTGISAELGWLNIFWDFQGQNTSGQTLWMQAMIDAAMSGTNAGLPLYLPPATGGNFGYQVTGGIVITGGVHLFGPPLQSSFALAGTTGIASSTRAMLWTSDNTLELLCVETNGVVIENVDLCVVPQSPSLSGGGMSIHLISPSIAATDVTFRSGIHYGPWNGVYLEKAKAAYLEDITVLPYASATLTGGVAATGGRFGFLTAASGGSNSELFSCSVDQTQTPFGSLAGTNPQTVDGFVSQDAYQTMILSHCRAIAAKRGFLTQQVAAGAGPVSFFQISDAYGYNCAAQVLMESLGVAYVKASQFIVDTSGTEPTGVLTGIAIPSAVATGSVTLTNNMIVGNASSSMVGLSIESAARVVAAGGAILGCGPQAGGGSGDGIFVLGALAGASVFSLAAVAVSGCAQAGLHIGAGDRGVAAFTSLLLIDNTNAASSGAGVRIDSLPGSNPGTIALIGSIITGNNVAVANANSAVTTGIGALPMVLANNIGYNPLGLMSGSSAPPTPVAGKKFTNNTGVDQYVYMKSLPGGVTIGGTVASSGVGSTMSVYCVPAGATIEITGAAPSSWTWFGN